VKIGMYFLIVISLGGEGVRIEGSYRSKSQCEADRIIAQAEEVTKGGASVGLWKCVNLLELGK